MNTMQTTTQISGRQIKATRAVTGAAILTVAAVALALAWGLVSRTLPGTATTGQRDPLAQAATVQFRQSEHAEAPARVTDPLAAPAVIQFRQSEHAAPPAAVNFRDSERADNYGTQWSTDPLAAPNIVQFRNSEHTDAGR